MRDRLKSRFRTLVSGIALRAIRAGVVSRRAVIVFGVIAGLLAVPAAAGAVLPGPNGRIVFTSGRDDGFSTFDDAHAQLWVADKAGAAPRRVTVNAGIQHRHASWSPDRTKLVYSAGNAATGDFDIYILDLTQPASGTNPRNITQSPGIADDRPSWSPDGTRVAYQSKVLGSKAPAQIVVESVTGPQVSVLTQPAGTGDAGKPVWSPDSKTLYYSLVVNPGVSPVDDDIYKKAADDSGAAIPVVTGPTDDYQPALSPDGQSLCFTRGAFGTTSATVQRSTITGGSVTQIANSGQGDYNCAWSPDGTKIAYVQGTFSNGDLKMKNSDGSGTATDLVPNVAGRFDGNPDWARNPSPTCQDKSVSIGFNGTAAILLNCVDPAPENDPVTLSIVTPPAHGSLGSIHQNSVTYTPQPNFSGADQFTIKGNDGTSDSNCRDHPRDSQPRHPRDDLVAEAGPTALAARDSARAHFEQGHTHRHDDLLQPLQTSPSQAHVRRGHARASDQPPVRRAGPVKPHAATLHALHQGWQPELHWARWTQPHQVRRAPITHADADRG